VLVQDVKCCVLQVQPGTTVVKISVSLKRCVSQLIVREALCLIVDIQPWNATLQFKLWGVVRSNCEALPVQIVKRCTLQVQPGTTVINISEYENVDEDAVVAIPVLFSS